MKESSYKIPEGKMIKIKLSIEESRIAELTIAGDFFLHPESSIGALEEALIGSALEPDNLENQLISAMKEESAQLIGVEPKDIVTAILMAAKE